MCQLAGGLGSDFGNSSMPSPIVADLLNIAFKSIGIVCGAVIGSVSADMRRSLRRASLLSTVGNGAGPTFDCTAGYVGI